MLIDVEGEPEKDELAERDGLIDSLKLGLKEAEIDSDNEGLTDVDKESETLELIDSLIEGLILDD